MEGGLIETHPYRNLTVQKTQAKHAKVGLASASALAGRGGWFMSAGGQVSVYWARWGCPYQHGDLNCDGVIDLGDINPFVLALTNPAAYDVDFPNCDSLLADMNCDGTVWFEDINPFVACLSYGDCGCP